jgi:hypothetical protein
VIFPCTSPKVNAVVLDRVWITSTKPQPRLPASSIIFLLYCMRYSNNNCYSHLSPDRAVP